MDKLHYIHSRGGRIGGRALTGPADVDAIVAALWRDPRRHLVLHFHGGLVSLDAGMAIAERLLQDYSPSPDVGGYPVFFVWESGTWETIRNNFTELADEPVFKQLLRKVVQYTVEHLGAQMPLVAARSFAPGSVGSLGDEVKQEFERFWRAPGPNTVPFRDSQAVPTQSRSAAPVNEDEILADLEQDFEVQRALSTLPDLPPGARSAFAATRGAAAQAAPNSNADAPGVERRSAFSEVAAHEFSKSSGARGLITLAAVAAFLVRVLRAMIKRYSAGRDHGLYATSVEELIRAFRLAGSSVNEWGKALQWNRMKQDTVDAFGPDANTHAGTALLSRLRAAIDSGLDLKRVTLIGHSTGAIHIANWLEHSVRYLPEVLKQNVVFLAPAITYDRFAETLRAYPSSISSFRMFAMQDALERLDQVWGTDADLQQHQDWRRFIYPSSLLYLVSGILESRREGDAWVDEADVPLLGMERFFANTKAYPGTDFPAIREVRAWLTAAPNRLVWSTTMADAAKGLCSGSEDHGAFDDDEQTLASLRFLLR